ncbi:MAG: hypothetical protein ACYCP0_10790 [Acidiferrobacteraceae bacterium]
MMEAERKPDAYLVHYRDISAGGSVRSVTIASLYPDAPTIWHFEETVVSREVLEVVPLYRRDGEGEKNANKDC